MNAPFEPDTGRSVRVDDVVERLVEDQLARDARWRATLRDRRTSKLQRFLRTLRSRRRAAAAARLATALGIERSAAAAREPTRRVTPRFTPIGGFSGRPRIPGFARRSALIAGISVVFVAGLLLAAEPALRPLLARVETPTTAAAETALRCGDATMVKGRDGEWIGVIPLVPCAAAARPHLTAAFDAETAEGVADAIRVLEGRWRPGALTLFGHDLAGIARYVVHRMDDLRRSPSAADGTDGEEAARPGGSAPILSAFESLIGDPHPVASVTRKLHYMAQSAVFDARVLGGDTAARAHFVAERLPVLDGHGYALAGAVGAEVLFGGAPRTLAERCLFAAAAGFPLWLPRPNADAGYLARQGERLRKARKRAGVCVAELAGSDAERAAALATIEAFVPHGRGVPARSLPLLPVLEGEMAVHGVAPRDGVVPTTVDGRGQRRAAAQIRRTLAGVEPRLAAGLCFDGDCETQADFLVALAEIEGDALALRIAATNRHGSLFGPVVTVDGGRTRGAPAFGLGSVHKIPLALVAARHHEARLCDRQYDGVQNADGSTGVARCAPERPAGWISTREALGRSLNLPWVDLAVRHAAEVDELERALGFGGVAAGPVGAALGFGRTAAPERFMALMAALERGSAGEPARTDGLTLLRGAPSQAVDLPGLGFKEAEIATAARWLEAPLAPGGTLSALEGALAPTGCTATRGKTGTGEVADTHAARSRVAVAVITCGQRRFVAFASLSSSHGRRPLGQIYGRDVAALIAAAVDGTSHPEGGRR